MIEYICGQSLIGNLFLELMRYDENISMVSLKNLFEYTDVIARLLSRKNKTMITLYSKEVVEKFVLNNADLFSFVRCFHGDGDYIKLNDGITREDIIKKFKEST